MKKIDSLNKYCSKLACVVIGSVGSGWCFLWFSSILFWTTFRKLLLSLKIQGQMENSYYHVKSPCICKVQTNHTIITLKTVEIFFGWFVFNFVVKFLFPNLSKDQTKYFGCVDWPTYYLIRLHVVDLKEITFPLEVFGQGYGPNGWLFPCSMAVGTIRKIQLDNTNCQTLILAVSLPVTRLIGG